MPRPNPISTAVRLRRISPLRPTLAIVLGSGFQQAASRVNVAVEIPYAKLPGFPRIHRGEALQEHFPLQQAREMAETSLRRSGAYFGSVPRSLDAMASPVARAIG